MICQAGIASTQNKVINVQSGSVEKALAKNRERMANYQGSRDYYLKSQSSQQDTSIAQNPPQPIPVTGNLTTLVMLAGQGGSLRAEDYRDLIFSVGTYFQNPTADASGTKNGSLRDYILENSYGVMDLDGDVRGWFPGVPSPPVTVEAFVTSLANQSDRFVDFARYDNDGPDGIPRSQGSTDDDGLIDFMVVVTSEELGTGPVGGVAVYEELATPIVMGDGISTDHAFFLPENSNSISPNLPPDFITPLTWWTYGLGINLGMPDLSDEDGTTVGVGLWDEMDQGGVIAGPSNFVQGTVPVHYSAWIKYQLGWVNPQVISTPQSGIRMRASAIAPDVVRTWRQSDPTGDEYYLIEYKSNNSGAIFDRGLPLPLGSGFLIWHADDALFKDPNLGTFEKNNDESHPLLRVEESDGLYNLRATGLNANAGDEGDAWPGSSGTFGVNTSPRTNDFSNIPTGVEITDFQTTAAINGSVSISFVQFAPELRIVVPGLVPVTPVRNVQEIRWFDSDPDSNASIGFYFSREPNVALDAQGLDVLRQTLLDTQGRRISGIIRQNISEDERTNRLSWNILDPEVAPGDYYIYGSITDGNTLLVVRSNSVVRVVHDTPPIIQVVEPDGLNDNADESFTIRWIDSGDADATIRVFYDTDNSGRNGVEITTSPIPASNPDNYIVWDTRDVYPIPYWIYAEITKPGMQAVYDYSDGPVRLNHPPSIEILEPSRQGESAVGSFSICWNDADLAQDATITLFYNTTNSIAGAVPINATGISEDDFVDCYLWNTRNVPPGCYYILGLIDDGQYLRTSVSQGTVCVEAVPPEVRVAVHDLTRVGQRIEATSDPTAILGIDANRADTAARLESITINVRDLSRGPGSFDIDTDLNDLLSSSVLSGIALYKDSLSFASESQFVSSSTLAAELPINAPLGTGEIIYQTTTIEQLALEPGDVVFLSGPIAPNTPGSIPGSGMSPFVAISTIRIRSGQSLVAEFDLVSPRGDFIFVQEGKRVKDIVPLHEPIEITDLVRSASSALTFELVLKENSPYRSSQSGARVSGNTEIVLVQLARLPDFTTNGFFNLGDELIPIQDVQVVNEGQVEIIPKFPPLLPNSSLGQDSGDDFFVVFRTSEKIDFLNAFQVSLPANGVLTSNGRKGNVVDTRTVEANPPTFIDPPVFPEGPPATPIALRQPLEPWPVFRISMSDLGQEVFLKSVRVNFQDFGGFTPATDLMALSTNGGGLSLHRDTNGDGFFTPGVDQVVTLASVPTITGTQVRSINLELPPDAFPLPDVNDRAPDLFVVIRPSDFILTGDQFKVSIPTGGIIYDYRNGVPAIISCGENALSALYRAETNQVQVSLVDLTSFGQRLERTSDLTPVIGIRIWDPSNLGPFFNTLESIDVEIVPVSGTITKEDFLPISGNGSGGVALIDAQSLLIGAGGVAAASDTGGLTVIETTRKTAVFSRTEVVMTRDWKAKVYLSGSPLGLEPFIVAGDIRINGDVAGQMRGYGQQLFWPNSQGAGNAGEPLDRYFAPHEPLDVSKYFNQGTQRVLIELIARDDTGIEPDNQILHGGNTPLYLVETAEISELGIPQPDADPPISIDATEANKQWGGLKARIVPLENTVVPRETFPTDDRVIYYLAIRTSETIDYLDSFKVRIPAGGIQTSRGRVGREVVSQTLTCNPPTFIAGIARSPSQPIEAPNFPHGAYAIGTSDNGLEDQVIESIEVHLHDLFGFSRTDLNPMGTQHGGVGLYQDIDKNGIFNPLVDPPIPIKPTQFLGVSPIRVIMEPETPWPLPDVNDSVADLFVAVNPSQSLEMDTLFSVEIPQRGIKFTNLRSGEKARSAAFSSEVNQSPFIDVLTPRAGGEVAGDSFRILWRDSDSDDDALINFYFSARGNIVNEVDLLTSKDVFRVRNARDLSENDETDALDWDTSERETNIVPGERYFVYAVIRDKNSTYFARSPGYVRVAREGLLSYVKLTSYGGVYGPGGVTLYGGPPLGLNPIATDIELLRGQNGYFVLDKTGHIYRFGQASILPSINPPVTNAVDMELTPDELGAYILLDDGDVRVVGNADFKGRVNLTPGAARDMASSPTGLGYVILDRDGQTYSFGDARSFNTATIPGGLAVDIELTPSGNGAFILDAFGGIHAYGDAPKNLDADIYGFDIARSLAVVPDLEGGVAGLLVLDGFGGVQSVGEINTMIDFDFSPIDIFVDIEAVNVSDVYRVSVLDVMERLYRAIKREDVGTIKSLFSTSYNDSHGNNLKRALEFFIRNFTVYEWQNRSVIGGLKNAEFEINPLSARAFLPTEDVVFVPSVITQDLTRRGGTVIEEIVVPFSQRVFMRKRMDARGFQTTVYDVDHSETFDIQTNPAFDDVIYRKFYEKDGDEVGDVFLNHESELENNAYAFVTDERFVDPALRFDNGILEIFWYEGTELLVASSGAGGSTTGSATRPIEGEDNRHIWTMVNEGGVYRIVKGTLYQFLPTYDEAAAPIGFRFDLPGPWYDTFPRDSDFRFVADEIATLTVGGGVANMTSRIGATTLDDVGQEDIDILTEGEWLETAPSSVGSIFAVRRPDGKTWGKIRIIEQSDDGILFDWEYRPEFIIKNPPAHIKPVE